MFLSALQVSFLTIGPIAQRALPLQATALPLSLGELIGAEVVLGVGGTGPAVAQDPPESPKGKVDELVVATQDGQIVCAALSVGPIIGQTKRVVLVATTAIDWSLAGKRPRCVLRMTKAEIGALPEFDVQTDGKDGLDRAVERARGLAGGGAAGVASTFVLSIRLKGSDVRASDKGFAKVMDVAVDVGRNSIGYLIVSRSGIAGASGMAYVVPFRACRWARAGGKPVLKLGQTSDQLESAPEYRKPAEGLLSLEQMKSADAFFAGSREDLGAQPQAD